MSPKKELILKIKALADNGVGGEKINAEKMLKHFMQKYNITDIDLESLDITEHMFTLKSDTNLKRLFWQICYRVLDVNNISYRERINSKKYVYIETTKEQFIEINAMYDFYTKKYKTDLELFLHAFVIKNNLAREASSDKQYTNEELERMHKITAMTRGLSKHSYNKQIDYERE